MGKRITIARPGRKRGRGEEAMGEVRVKAKLANAMDETLVKVGQLRASEVRRCAVDAMVDTGAVRTVVPPQVAQQLGLAILRQTVVELASGNMETVNVGSPVTIDVNGWQTSEEVYVLGNEVLIGQTMLEALDLHVDCRRGRLVPNPAHPDQPVTKVK